MCNRVLAERAACQRQDRKRFIRLHGAGLNSVQERGALQPRLPRSFRLCTDGVQAADGRGAPAIDLARATPAKWLRTVLA
jgi:hypothetical protein